ncbi:MAG: mannosyltransferase family protein [Candidatus Bathyarchaeia archaeon]|jgi:Gpi18-like mannosyltransferase
MRIREAVTRHRSLVEICNFFTSTRLLVLLVGWLSSLVIIKSEFYHNPQSIVDLFFRWDSGWYLSIVQNGYSYVPGKPSNVAFFPLYPSLVKIFSFGFADVRITGIVLSNVALLLAMIYLFRLVKLDYQNTKMPLNSVIFALIFPASFFFSIFYAESLFLFLTVACFYYARKNRWFLSSLFGFFAALTRALGVFIFIPILIEYLAPTSFKDLKLGKIKKDILCLLLIPAGLLTYMTYLYIRFNEPLAFLKAETAWSRVFAPGLLTLQSLFSYDPFYRFTFLGFVALSILMLVFLIYSKVRISYIVYTAVELFFILSSSLLESLPRYVGVLFPMYIGFAIMARNRFWEETLKMLSVSLLTLFVILFVNGYWLT